MKTHANKSKRGFVVEKISSISRMQLKIDEMADDNAVVTGNKLKGSIPNDVLECFWGIADLDDEKRQKSSLKLLNILNVKKVRSYS